MEKFSLHENMDKLDSELVINFANNAGWPKGKRYTVDCNGVKIKLQTYFPKENWQSHISYGAYDAHAAIEAFYRRQLSPQEIGWENDGSPQYDMPEFNRDALTCLTREQIETRTAFAVMIANLINNQETMEAIAKAAVKKKDGTLNKNRIIRIAGCGMSNGSDGISAIVARPASDTSLSVKYDYVKCKPGDNDIWKEDFISTYQDGAFVKKALGK